MTLDVLRRKAFALALLVALAAAAGAATVWAGRPTARAHVVLAPVAPPDLAGPPVPSADGAGADPAGGRAAAEAAVAGSATVLAAAADTLRRNGSVVDAERLRDQVRVVADDGALVVEATAATPDEARARADAVVAAYRRFAATAVTRRAEAVARAARDAGTAARARAAAAAFGDGVLVADPARTDGRGRDAAVRALAAGAAAGLLGAGAAVRREARRGGRGRAARLAGAAGVPVAGVVRRRPVPAVQGLATDGSPAARAFEAAAVVLDAVVGELSPDGPCAGRRTVLVVPARARRAAGTGAAELAAAHARLGAATVLARLEEYPLSSSPDRASRALGRADGLPEVVIAPSLRGAPDVAVVRVAGSPTGAAGRGPVDLAAVCAALPEAVEVVVLSGPAPGASGVALRVAAQADVVVLEADRRAGRSDVVWAVDRLRAVTQAPVVLLARPGGPLATLWAWAQADLRAPAAVVPDPARAPLTPARHPNRTGAAVGGAPAGWWSPGRKTPAGR